MNQLIYFHTTTKQCHWKKKPSIDPNRKRNRHFHSAFGRWLVWLDLTWPHPSFILLVAWYPWLIYCNRDLSPPQFSVAWVGKTWKANSERKHFSFPFRRQPSHIVSDVTSFFFKKKQSEALVNRHPRMLPRKLHPRRLLLKPKGAVTHSAIGFKRLHCVNVRRLLLQLWLWIRCASFWPQEDRRRKSSNTSQSHSYGQFAL